MNVVKEKLKLDDVGEEVAESRVRWEVKDNSPKGAKTH